MAAGADSVPRISRRGSLRPVDLLAGQARPEHLGVLFMHPIQWKSASFLAVLKSFLRAQS